ncbi:MAG: hypothetical protein R3B68_02235 [Phycisphaerales bacterium]
MGSLAGMAHGYAIELLAQGGPLVPFVLREGSGTRTIDRFVSGLDDEGFDLGQSVEDARNAARSPGPDRVVVAYEGVVSQRGKNVDAVIIEAFESGMEECLVIVQLFRPADHPRGFALIGEMSEGDPQPPMW